MTQPQPRYQPGDRIGGRYEVYKALMGGMGEVYLCLDLEEMIPLALKTFQQRYQSTALRKAFEHEVATWVALEKHPNIVRCFMMEILDNQPFMILEWIAGEEGKGADLRGWLRRGPLDLRTALEIAIHVVRGLIHAQKKQPGLVHRDLKPENILVAQGGLAKITDFGLVQIVQNAGLEVKELGTPNPQSTTVSIVNPKYRRFPQGGNIQNLIVGTPAYMAPEQWRGEALDERTDIYAVGCILYEMLTGQWLFKPDSTTPQQRQQWLSVLQDNYENIPPPVLSVDLPNALREIVRRCMAKSSGDRPATVASLMEQLIELYKQQFGQHPPPCPPTAAFNAFDFNNRGTTYHSLKRYNKALADYTRAIDLNPNLVQAYSNRGTALADLHQYKEALADYGQAIDLDPNFAQAYYNRATTLVDLHQFRQALSDYGRAIAIDPNYARAYYNRGATLAKLHQYEEALADYNRAIALAPNLVHIYSNRGTIYRTLQRYEEALADYNRAIILNPNSAQAYYKRGIIYHDLKQYSNALADYTHAIDLKPDYAQAYYNRGIALANLQRYEEALTNYGQAIDFDPNLAMAYCNRGTIYHRLQRYDEAVADYKRAVAINPSDEIAYVNIAVILRETGRLKDAIPYLEKADRLGHPNARQYLAQARQMLGVEASPQIDPVQAAVEAFRQAASVEEMRQTVARFPFMVKPDLIAAIEQIIAQQAPPAQRPHFEERLGWLKQIAQEQTQ